MSDEKLTKTLVIYGVPESEWHYVHENVLVACDSLSEWDGDEVDDLRRGRDLYRDDARALRKRVAELEQLLDDARRRACAYAVEEWPASEERDIALDLWGEGVADRLYPDEGQT